MSEPFDVGDELRLTVTCFNDAGQLADPTTVACIVRAPDGRRLDLATGRVSQGVYEAFVVVDEPKTWGVRFETNGGVTGAEEATFVVRKSRVL